MSLNFLLGDKITKEPNLLFDKVDSSAVHHLIYWGLLRYGPYDKEISKIRVAIISPTTRVEQVRRLLEELDNGLTVMPGGMKRFFGCSLEIVKEISLVSEETFEYESKCKSFVASTDLREVDVVIVYIPKTSRYLSYTPYYRAKAILAAEGYASQMITEFTFQNLKWSCLNLASAIYSKAGGIPWVLESNMKNTDMLIGLSISNPVSLKYRAGGSRKYIGHVNVFDNYGKWMFFEGTAKLYEKERKHEQLKELLSIAVNRFKSEKGFDPHNIIIHYYKKWGKEEMEIIIKILNELIGDFQVAFISIDDSHPFRLYDTSVEDGSFPRGYYTYLTYNDILLSTTGHTSISTKRMGTPKLLHITLYKQYPKMFINLDDIALQIFSLTKLNWATATPLVREPVTVKFSRELAYLTAAISEQEWESITRQEINITLRKRPWFI